MRAWLRLSLILVMLLQLAGCASTAGIAEFSSYKESFDAAQGATNSLLDRVAVAERQNFARTTAGQNATRDFSVSEVSYIAPSMEPPVARAYRQAFATLSHFNNVVLGLALGRPAETLVNEIATLGSESLGLASSLQIVGDAALESLVPYKQLAERLATVALAAQSRETFRAELIREAPNVRELMQTLRDGAPILFRFLVASARAESEDARAGLPGASEAAFAERAKNVRPLLAEWVVIMDRNMAALAAAEAAAASETPAFELASARAALIEARLAAATLRKGLAELPRG